MSDTPDETRFTILPIHGGSGRVSDPQTVRDAIRFTGVPNNVCSILGIDPDLPVETLKRRLLWGERVEQGPDIGAHDYQAWLTREEA